MKHVNLLGDESFTQKYNRPKRQKEMKVGKDDGN